MITASYSLSPCAGPYICHACSLIRPFGSGTSRPHLPAPPRLKVYPLTALVYPAAGHIDGRDSVAAAGRSHSLLAACEICATVGASAGRLRSDCAVIWRGRGAIGTMGLEANALYFIIPAMAVTSQLLLFPEGDAHNKIGAEAPGALRNARRGASRIARGISIEMAVPATSARSITYTRLPEFRAARTLAEKDGHR